MKNAEVVAALRALGMSEERARDAGYQRSPDDRQALKRALLLRAFWTEVIDDAGRPWLTEASALRDAQFPFLDAAALGRVLATGASLEDVAAVVRSVQILTLYNVTQILDGDVPELDTFATIRNELSWDLGLSLHSEFEGDDPTGRNGEPLQLEERRLASFPPAVRAEILSTLSTSRPRAALAWRKHTGESLQDSRVAVDRLASLPHLRRD